MARSPRVMMAFAPVLATCLAASAVQAQTNREDIHWNDPATPSATAPISPTNTAPIRDDYATSPPSQPPMASAPPQNLVPPPPPTHAGDQAITWSEPSVPPKDNAGKANISVKGPPPMPPMNATASAVPPGSASTCREYQQDVVIDGRRTVAHGHACRQPDGSWRIID